MGDYRTTNCKVEYIIYGELTGCKQCEYNTGLEGQSCSMTYSPCNQIHVEYKRDGQVHNGMLYSSGAQMTNHPEVRVQGCTMEFSSSI